MKTNQDKLNDALGMVDEETVRKTMLHAEGMKAAHLSRRAVMRRRLTVLAAACLMLTLMVGAVLAVPYMRADDPGTTEPGGSTMAPAVEDFYIKAPIVKLSNLSAGETVVISDSDVPKDSTVCLQKTDFLFEYNILTFDCQPGETVTVTADVDCLHYIDMPMNAETDELAFLEALRESPIVPADSPSTGYDAFLTIDPFASCISIKPFFRVRMDDENEQILNYTVRNEAGEITGAGTVYVCYKYLMTKEERANMVFAPVVTRAAVLGSVRFTNPAEVTEEKVTELMDTFAAEKDTVKANLNFSPVTTFERTAYAQAEILRSEFSGAKIVGGTRGFSSDEAFTDFCVSTESDGERTERYFIIFADGTWIEYLGHGDCHFGSCHVGCPLAGERGEHHAFHAGCRLKTTDGQIYEYQLIPETESYTWVLIPNAHG